MNGQTKSSASVVKAMIPASRRREVRKALTQPQIMMPVAATAQILAATATAGERCNTVATSTKGPVT